MAEDISILFPDAENDLFYFESDHLALRGNKDYCEVLKTIVILSAQREKALKDYNKIVEIQKKVLEDPLTILDKYLSGELAIELPQPIELPKIPVINFDKFDVKVSESDLKTIYSDSVEEKPEEECKKFKVNNSNNKTWTTDEQKRLEELLLIYPPEPIEMRRFHKIAVALGNRTVQQVTSRVQKYFLKLYKAGLPIPGRVPKSSEKYRKSLMHKHQRYNHYLWKPTTFFPDLHPPVTMDELDNMPGPSASSPATSASSSSNYLLPTDYHQNADVATRSSAERQLQLLKRIKAEKVREHDGSYNSFRHVGYKCDYCNDEPLVGVRWHCISCSDSVDFCTDCLLAQMYSNNVHPLTHVFAIFYNDTENPNVPLSDSDSNTGSAVTNKNYESDSNCSADFDSNSNLDSITQMETNYFDSGNDHDNGYELPLDSDI